MKDFLTPIAKLCSATNIKIHRQKQLIRNSSLFQGKPIISPTGTCQSLALEWYRYTILQRDFFAEWESPSNEFLQRLKCIQEASHSAVCEILLKGMIDYNNFCKQNIMDPWDVSKLYGFDPLCSITQWNFFTLDGKSYRTFGIQHKGKTSPEVDNDETETQSIYEFDKFLENFMQDIEVGILKKLTYVTLWKKEDGYFHAPAHNLAITATREGNDEILYRFYDPNLGEADFDNVANLRTFVSLYMQNEVQRIKPEYAFGMYGHSYQDNLSQKLNPAWQEDGRFLWAPRP